MNPRKNKNNKDEFEKIRKQISILFPQKIKLGFYIQNYKDSRGVKNQKLKNVLASGVAFIEGDQVDFRQYRHADKGTHQFDVDEIEGINKDYVMVKSKNDIQDHHLDKSIPDDLMSKRNLVLEVIEDKDGTFRLNSDGNGMVRAYISFPDPFNKK